MLNEPFQALEGVLLSLLLKLLCRHLLTEGEHYTAAKTDIHSGHVLVYTSVQRACLGGVFCVNVRATLSGSRPCCRVCRAFVTALVRDSGV